VRKCIYCGGNGLKRVHRTFFERFNYLAIYECRSCAREQLIPRQHTFHLGEYARCPRCGSARVTRLHGPDKIDRMFSGPLNTLERLSGGKLHHCCFCRIQFYDRRKLAPRSNVQPYPSADAAGDTVVEREMIDPGATSLPDKAS
jgi:DNA-directed RNA polymerase subunit RPC12/RpoP